MNMYSTKATIDLPITLLSLRLETGHFIYHPSQGPPAPPDRIVTGHFRPNHRANDQLSFASLEYAAKEKRTKRDVFLAEMAAVVPWSLLEGLIEPHYPKLGPQGGRRPFPLSAMLRICCLQQWRQGLRERRQRASNRRFGKVLAKVEHIFRIVKCQFDYRKVRYPGIAKNGAQVFSMLALANLFLARSRIASARGRKRTERCHIAV